MDCLDCKNCKVKYNRGTIECKIKNPLFGKPNEKKFITLWKKDNGEDKTYKLKAQEIKTGYIGWREIFAQGRNCPSIISMIEDL